MTGIYKITNPKGLIYIGQSKNIPERLLYYKKLNCKSQTKLYHSLKKYGYENHIFECIEECDFNLLNDRERYYQEKYKCIIRGIGLNCILQETKHKKRIVSYETRLKISKNGKGRVMSDETKQKIRESKKYLSKEARLKLSLCNKGKPKSEAHKLKLSQLKKGQNRFPHTEETKQKMRESRKKYKLTQQDYDTINKMALMKRKIIIDTETGVYYFGVKEAAFSKNINKGTLNDYLLGRCKNKTSFTYA